MQAPLYVRRFTEEEQAAIEAGRRSSQGFTVRRCQILLASAQGQATTVIARLMGCNDQTVRNAISDFHQRGLAALQPKSSRPHTTHEVFDEEGRERLRALLHQSPRNFGKNTSIWTLDLAAEVSFTVGIASRPISGQTIRNALKLLGVGWKRAKHWITSPDPDYLRKKTVRAKDAGEQPQPSVLLRSADRPGVCGGSESASVAHGGRRSSPVAARANECG